MGNVILGILSAESERRQKRKGESKSKCENIPVWDL